MSEVQPALTMLSEADMFEHLATAIYEQAKGNASPEAVALALAHTALETGRGKKMHNYNFGHLTKSKEFPGDFYLLQIKEQIKPGIWKLMDMKFRAYSSPLAGASDYIDFLSTQNSGRYAKAYEYLLLGEPENFVTELHKQRYFTANPGPYINSVVSLYREYKHRYGIR